MSLKKTNYMSSSETLLGSGNPIIRDRSFFMREGGLVGFGKHHLKIA